MPEETQTGTETTATETAAADATARLAELEQQIQELKNGKETAEQAAQFWSEKAKAAAPKQETRKEADEDEDLLTLITEKGARGLDSYLAKKGFVRADEVDKRVEEKARTIATENKLTERYPDLRDKGSDFFKATSRNYHDLKAQGMPDHAAMELAAERTELNFLRTGKLKIEGDKTTAKKDKTAQADERRARADAQSPARAVRAAEAEDEDDELTEDQKRIAHAIIGGDPAKAEEAYKARAKAGVKLGGRVK